MDYAAYLLKIGCHGDFIPNIITLKRFQKKHLLCIPFENLDIYYGNKISSDINEIHHKVVHGNRGGFCYELNTLFYHLLLSKGFDARIISARVYHKNKGFGQEFDHLTIAVNLEGADYLVDVGFGEFAFAPLKISLNQSQKDKRGTFRITRYDDTHLLVSAKQSGKWRSVYLFSLQGRDYDEFAGMCHYHQTHPDSHFTQKRICSRPTEEGRITLTGNRLMIKDDKGLKTTAIRDEETFFAYLEQYFQIKAHTVLQEKVDMV